MLNVPANTTFTSGGRGAPRPLGSALVAAVGIVLADSSVVILALPEIYRQFDVSVGVQKDNQKLLKEIDRVLIRRKQTIDKLLADYHFPQVRGGAPQALYSPGAGVNPPNAS